MTLPTSLKQKIHYDYVQVKYSEGILSFPMLDEQVVESIVNSLFCWAEDNKLIQDDKFDISGLKR